ncbi:hypothetical protein GF407_14485 [candidate division KSB1 bacterium]|nr:hypothetical protein [candidate division KSB1 bacterium]
MDEQYCEPTSGPIFIHDDPGGFLWYSERSGYRHLYLYQRITDYLFNYL